jgi:prepilin-type processing-associated H-X9-DG protein
MKPPRSYRRNHGLTLMETVVVAFSLAVVAAVLVPALSRPHGCQRLNCTNNLKQIGLAVRIWSGDNNDKYPMAVAVTNGGAMEDVLAGNPMRVFEVMSNELSTTKILVCQEDKDRQVSTNNFFALTAKNVSYFVNPDATDTNSSAIMCGDDNLELNGIRIRSGLSLISSNSPIAWSAARHKHAGNLLLADGSVQGANNSGLKYYFFNSTNAPTMHLAIP